MENVKVKHFSNRASFIGNPVADPLLQQFCLVWEATFLSMMPYFAIYI